VCERRGAVCAKIGSSTHVRARWRRSRIRSVEQNHILRALPPEVRARLLPHLRLVSLPLGMVLCESGSLMPHIYFPTDAIVSLLYVLDGAR
jgi:hypothetical protein